MLRLEFKISISKYFHTNASDSKSNLNSMVSDFLLIKFEIGGTDLDGLKK